MCGFLIANDDAVVSLRCLVVSTPLNTTQSCPGMSSAAVAVLYQEKSRPIKSESDFTDIRIYQNDNAPAFFCDVAAAVQTGETPSGWIAARYAGVLENNAILLSLMAFWCFLWRIPKEMDGNGGCIWVWCLGWCVCNGHQHSPLFNLGKPFCLLEMVPDWQLSSERKSRGQLVRAKVGAFFLLCCVCNVQLSHRTDSADSTALPSSCLCLICEAPQNHDGPRAALHQDIL